jgi:hypothetical protein
MRTATWIALFCLAGCASKPTPKPTWHPIQGAHVTPWEQTRAICDPILQRGRARASAEDEAARTERAKAKYRACMGQNGWTDRAVSPETSEARSADAQQLRAQIDESRTKNALTMAVGEPPECQPGDPGTEICKWRWTRHLPNEDVRLRMTCVLPRDGKPRAEGSCRYGVDTAK